MRINRASVHGLDAQQRKNEGIDADGHEAHEKHRKMLALIVASDARPFLVCQVAIRIILTLERQEGELTDGTEEDGEDLTRRIHVEGPASHNHRDICIGTQSVSEIADGADDVQSADGYQGEKCSEGVLLARAEGKAALGPEEVKVYEQHLYRIEYAIERLGP